MKFKLKLTIEYSRADSIRVLEALCKMNAKILRSYPYEETYVHIIIKVESYAEANNIMLTLCNVCTPGIPLRVVRLRGHERDVIRIKSYNENPLQASVYDE